MASSQVTWPAKWRGFGIDINHPSSPSSGVYLTSECIGPRVSINQARRAGPLWTENGVCVVGGQEPPDRHSAVGGQEPPVPSGTQRYATAAATSLPTSAAVSTEPAQQLVAAVKTKAAVNTIYIRIFTCLAV